MTVSRAKTLAESVFRRLRADILSGDLAPGVKLRIDDLRTQYGIGASPLREALNRLTAEGLVDSIGQRGFTVAAISPEDLTDITRMRIMLETEALRESIAGGDDEWEANVVAAYYRLSKIDPQDDFAAWEARNDAFHDALVAACSSNWLLRFRRILYDQHKRYRSLCVMYADKRDITAEHKAIQNAAIRRDADAACKATALHIERTAIVIQKAFEPSHKNQMPVQIFAGPR